MLRDDAEIRDVSKKGGGKAKGTNKTLTILLHISIILLFFLFSQSYETAKVQLLKTL